MSSKQPMDIRPFQFYNDGKKQQFSDKDQKDIFTQLLLRKVQFRKPGNISNFQTIRIRFGPGPGREPWQFPFKNLQPDKTKENLYYFGKNKDFILINLPAGCEEILMEIEGELDAERFELDIEYFLV